MWAAAQIVTSQKDGAACESGSMNVSLPLLGPHASGKTSVMHKTEQCRGKIVPAKDLLLIPHIWGYLLRATH